MKDIKEFNYFLNQLFVNASIENTGWHRVFHDAESAADKQMYIYVYDTKSEWVWMAGISRKDFFDAAFKGAGLLVDRLHDLYMTLESYVSYLSETTIKQPEIESNLGLAVSLYAGTTGGFKFMNGLNGKEHFCMILYRGQEPSKNLRFRHITFAETTSKPVLIDNFKRSLEQTIMLDKIQHPEWFN
jgi:hypothetical protein